VKWGGRKDGFRVLGGREVQLEEEGALGRSNAEDTPVKKD